MHGVLRVSLVRCSTDCRGCAITPKVAHNHLAHTLLNPRASPSRARLGIVAALTILSHNEPAQLSLQQHLELTPDLVAYSALGVEGDPEPSMMAQQVPHPATDKKRVKVYELRNNDWYDRGTGFCTAAFATVRTALLP